MKRYIPSGYSQTGDSFAALMVDAPEFSTHGQTIAEAFEEVQLGLDSVIGKSKKSAATELLQFCKHQLAEIELIFTNNMVANDPHVHETARKRLQHLYYESYRKVGPLLKPGHKGSDIGPDDDV